MMNKIFSGIIILSVLCGIFSGRGAQTGQAAFTGAGDAITLAISLAGPMCLWCGMMKVMEESELSKKLSKVLSPVIGFLFPEVPKNSPAFRAITLNITAEMIGLSNAATPLGITAMQELAKLSPNKHTANLSMSTLVVLNTASIQLIPTTILALRVSNGSKSPFDIVVPILCASFCAAAFGVVCVKICGRLHNAKAGTGKRGAGRA